MATAPVSPAAAVQGSLRPPCYHPCGRRAVPRGRRATTPTAAVPHRGHRAVLCYFDGGR